MGIPSQVFLTAASTEDAIATAPNDAEAWRRCGDTYRGMAALVLRNTRPVGEGSAAIQLRSFRTHAVGALTDLARDRYEGSLEIDPAGTAARYGLASVLGAQGEYQAASDLLAGLERESFEGAPGGVSFGMAMGLSVDLRARRLDPFGFMTDVQKRVLDQVSQAEQ
jgi:hypothetical protein